MRTATKFGAQRRWRAAGCALAVLTAACAPPIGVNQLSPPEANRALTINVLSTGQPSVYSLRILQRLGLVARYEDDAPGVLAELNGGLGGYDEWERMLALAELSFAHAQESGDRAYFIAAAVYAWTFLGAEGDEWGASPYDERVRLAADLYNRGIALGLMDADGKYVDLAPRTLETLFGSVVLDADPSQFLRGNYRFHSFVSLADFAVKGLRNRYRTRGIGAPLSASIKLQEGLQASRWIGANAKLPVTLLVRFDDARNALAAGRLQGRIELLNPELVATAEVEGRSVVLEDDPTAALAYRLEGSPLWDFEIAGFRRGDFSFKQGQGAGLYMLEPYRPGAIPVVFVHGTASSPARWAEMANEILADPILSARAQLWFFLYETGNPIAYSAMLLRDALTATARDLDPGGNDPAFDDMVLIGHSQGGLLIKLMVVDSGTRFWDAMSKVPFADVKLRPETRAELERVMFVKPLPFVDRVVFVATPQHGSFVAENWIGSIARRLVTFPARLLRIGVDLVSLQAQGVVPAGFKMPTSVDNMRGDHPFMRTLASLSLEQGVHAHSIIAVKGDGPVEEGDDGVVRYSSAHIDGVDSELVVRSPHSVQGHPQAIEEVRRILHEHVRVNTIE